MKFGYKGKHEVKQRRFKLYTSGGKRVKQKPLEENFFYQTIQLLSGKVKYLFSKVQQFGERANAFFEELDAEYYDDEDMELEAEMIDSEEVYSMPMIERVPFARFNGEEKTDNVRIANLDVASLDEIEDVVFYIEQGCIVLVNYSLLSALNRAEFDKRLSMELMLRGTYLVHVSSTVIACASNNILIEDRISPKKEGKVYDLRARMKR